jgi:hypothetical protein
VINRYIARILFDQCFHSLFRGPFFVRHFVYSNSLAIRGRMSLCDDLWSISPVALGQTAEMFRNLAICSTIAKD